MNNTLKGGDIMKNHKKTWSTPVVLSYGGVVDLTSATKKISATSDGIYLEFGKVCFPLDGASCGTCPG